MKLLNVQSSLLSCHLLRLGPKYSQHPADQVAHPYKTTVPYVLVLLLTVCHHGGLTAFVSVHRFDVDKKLITVEVVVPEAHFTGNYEVKGKLIALPIVGRGTLDAKFCEFSIYRYSNCPFFEKGFLKRTEILVLL